VKPEEFKAKAEQYMGHITDRETQQWHHTLTMLSGAGYTWEMAEAYLQRIKEREGSRAVHQAVKGAMEGSDSEDRIKAKLDEYKNVFVPETPNDMAMLRQMAHIEIQQDIISRALLSAPVAERPAEFKNLLEVQQNLNTQYRRLQETLGIDRKTRDQQAGGSDVRERVEGVIADAADFYRRKVVVVEHCGVILGHVLAHFLGWEIRMTCPRCNKTVVVTHQAMKEAPYVIRQLPEQRREVPDDAAGD
jgi:hypothetical protein